MNQRLDVGKRKIFYLLQLYWLIEHWVNLEDHEIIFILKKAF